MLARKKGGFTLIELLVVIAIIAILAAILFPVFARAREAARKSTCQSNMKECAIALQTYWNDYDAMLPSSANGTATTWTAAAFVAFASKLNVIPPPSSGAVTWCQKLYNSMRSRDIMFCPSDSTDHNPLPAAAPTTSVSYWWKLAIDMAWFGAGGSTVCRKEGDFGYNADQIVFYERAGFHSGAQQGLKNDVMINVAYLDTHVRSISVVNSNYAATGSTYQTSATADGEPNYFNFNNSLPKSTINPPKPSLQLPPGKFVDPTMYSDSL